MSRDDAAGRNTQKSKLINIRITGLVGWLRHCTYVRINPLSVTSTINSSGSQLRVEATYLQLKLALSTVLAICICPSDFSC